MPCNLPDGWYKVPGDPKIGDGKWLTIWGGSFRYIYWAAVKSGRAILLENSSDALPFKHWDSSGYYLQNPHERIKWFKKDNGVEIDALLEEKYGFNDEWADELKVEI